MVTLIGGGYIGMEFAGMFARLGCEVHVVARQALPLAPRFDAEVSRTSGALRSLKESRLADSHCCSSINSSSSSRCSAAPPIAALTAQPPVADCL